MSDGLWFLVSTTLNEAFDPSLESPDSVQRLLDLDAALDESAIETLLGGSLAAPAVARLSLAARLWVVALRTQHGPPLGRAEVENLMAVANDSAARDLTALRILESETYASFDEGQRLAPVTTKFTHIAERLADSITNPPIQESLRMAARRLASLEHAHLPNYAEEVWKE